MSRSIPIYGALELSEKEFPEEEWLLKPFLPRGGDWLVAGEEDACKSLFLLQMCIYASMGLDYHMLQVEKPLKFLYIGADDNAREVQKRLNALNTTGQPLNDNFKIICQPGIDFDVRGREQIIQWVEDVNPDIVIFDHLTAYVVGGTNDHHGMHDYGKMKALIKQLDKGVIALTHYNRTTSETKNEPEGRRVGGTKAVKSDHGIITLHGKLSEATIDHGKRISVKVDRNKNDGGIKGAWDTQFEVVIRPDGKTIFKEF
jgi:RecA-family ATPase